MQELRKKNKKTEWNWLHHPILLSLDQCFLCMVHPTRLLSCEPSAAPWHWCELRQGWISSPGWWSGSLEGGQWALNQWQCPSHPLSFSTLGGKSAKNFQPFLTHPLKKAKKKHLCIISPVSCTVPCTCTCIMAAWLSDPWILPDLDILCKHHPLWNTAAQFSDPHTGD